jgi:hypothetical protein
MLNRLPQVQINLLTDYTDFTDEEEGTVSVTDLRQRLTPTHPLVGICEICAICGLPPSDGNRLPQVQINLLTDYTDFTDEEEEGLFLSLTFGHV